ncbi:MAG: AAA family ATPase [Pseudomonadota bacterium]
MKREFRRGLVVGKFSPLHLGHEFVIRTAMERCREVVLITYSNPEFPGCGALRRERWLAEIFPSTLRLVLDPERPSSLAALPPGLRAMPPNDAPERDHRVFVGALCTHVLGLTVDAVFTSEDYGDGFAAELTNWFRRLYPGTPEARHILVDRERGRFPVSGTALRADFFARRDWVSPSVGASLVRRVCLLGGESSGKTTLAAALGTHFGTAHVPEYGRELWEARGGMLVYEDMVRIAREQISREEAAALVATKRLFCDTSPLATLFYSRRLFGRADPELERLAERKYDLTVLCAPDFPFVQDGTRQPPAFRDIQHQWHERELRRRGLDYFTARGLVGERVRAVAGELARRFGENG